MRGILRLALGVMTAIGGFVDISNLVTSGVTGARFGMSLTWAIVLGTIGMILYGEMAGRLAAIAKRPVFHVVRERLGVRTGLANLAAVEVLSLLTLAAEIGGVALVLELFTGVHYLVWVPVAGAVTALIVWRMPFSTMENLFGLLGLSLLVFVVALFVLPTDWGSLWHGVTHPRVPAGEGHPTYFFYAISLIGSCIIPYQVIFFSSGGREERWTPRRLTEMRLNLLVGIPLGGLLSIAIMAAAAVVLQPGRIQVSHLGQVALPVVQALGTVGVVLVLVGFAATTLAAAVVSALSMGYGVTQYFGWPWGKDHRFRQAPRFHLMCLGGVVTATAFMLTGINPIQMTIVSVVLGAAAVPLTYFPLLVVANDRAYLGQHINGRWLNAVATIFMLVMVVTSLAALPLLLFTRAGE